MKLRVIEEQDNYGVHYTPQYFQEGRGWRECELDGNLVNRRYYKPEEAIAVCKAYKERFAEVVVWSEDTDMQEG